MKRVINRIGIVLGIVLAACGGDKGNQSASVGDLETEYIRLRDGYRVAMAKTQEATQDWDAIDEANGQALLDLQGRLRLIVPEPPWGEEGVINLQTMLDEVGVDMLDGLTLARDSSTLFITTRNLFDTYFKGEKQGEFSAEFLEKVVNSTFVPDAQVSIMGLTTFDVEGSTAYGMAAGAAQDVGPITPQSLYVFVAKGDRIFIAQKGLAEPLPEVPDCTLLWEKSAVELDKAFADYQASGLKDTTALNRRWQIEDETMKAYCRCYQERLESSPQFESIKENLGTMARRLLRP